MIRELYIFFSNPSQLSTSRKKYLLKRSQQYRMTNFQLETKIIIDDFILKPNQSISEKNTFELIENIDYTKEKIQKEKWLLVHHSGTKY